MTVAPAIVGPTRLGSGLGVEKIHQEPETRGAERPADERTECHRRPKRAQEKPRGGRERVR